MNIISLSNAKVKNWAKLNQKKYRDLTNTFLVEDEHLVKEAIKSNRALEIISLSPYDTDLPNYIVTPEIMKKISNQVSGCSIACVCKKNIGEDIECPILILDALQDPGNLGTIIRSAVAFNFKTIILGDNTVDVYNDKVIRATEGMLFHINIMKKNLISYIPHLQKQGYQIIGTDVNKGVDIRKVKKNKKLALVIGNEGNGINKNVKDLCDCLVNISLNEACESLNAAVAASILMYEMR